MSVNQWFIDLVAQKVTREIDAGEFSPQRAGQKLLVWVNPPGIVETLFGNRPARIEQTTDENGKPKSEFFYEPENAQQQYARRRRAVAILFGMPLEQIERVDDSTINWLFNAGYDAYLTYQEELRANLTNG